MPEFAVTDRAPLSAYAREERTTRRTVGAAGRSDGSGVRRPRRAAHPRGRGPAERRAAFIGE